MQNNMVFCVFSDQGILSLEKCKELGDSQQGISCYTFLSNLGIFEIIPLVRQWLFTAGARTLLFPECSIFFFGQKHIVAGRGLGTNTDSASFVTAGAKRNLIFFVSFRKKLGWVGRDPPKGLSRRKNHPWIDTHLFFLCQTSPHDENSKRRTTVSREK